MMHIKEEIEKMATSAEERELEEEETEQEEEETGQEEEEVTDAGDEEDGSDAEDDCRSNEDKEKNKEALPQASDKTETNIQLPVQPREKTKSDGLNLNNEVVRMRKEVKRVRALIIRKLTRQISSLKKKKGKETEIERNQKRASRLLEEIHAMKTLSPDLVTKTALQKNLNFEKECKNPKSTISDRAIARIASHPQFSKKIEDIKAAVKSFKEERMKGGQEVGKAKVLNKAVKGIQQSPSKKQEVKREKEEITVEEKTPMDTEEGDGVFKDIAYSTYTEPEKKADKAGHSGDISGYQRKEMPGSKNVRPASARTTKVKDIVKNAPPSRDLENKHKLKPVSEVLQKKEDEEESDLESSDEEKEYFDDSTEERFHKQSSQSEESDEDDFFVGKVSKFKKKKPKTSGIEKGNDVKMGATDEVQSKLVELESSLKSKTTSLQSVFCSSLGASKPGGGRGAESVRGRDRLRGHGKPRGGAGGLKRDFSKQSKFQRQEKGGERHLESKNSNPESSQKVFSSRLDSRGKGRGRGNGLRKNDHRDGSVFSHKVPQQALHPSWEASKKRKEQQGQILAFQGKKIKFDDDD